jgi:hypothetical protein
MCPGDGQEQKLHADHVGAGDPIGQQRRRIDWRIASKQHATESHDPKMACDQQRNTQPEYQLGDLDDRVAKMPTLIERPEPQQKMGCCSGIKCKIDDGNSPPPDVETKPRFHGVIREIAERMIEKMRKYVRKHHEAATKPHLANAYPA